MGDSDIAVVHPRVHRGRGERSAWNGKGFTRAREREKERDPWGVTRLDARLGARAPVRRAPVVERVGEVELERV